MIALDTTPPYPRDLLGYELVWAAAGRPDSVFEIAPDRLKDLSHATVLDLKAT